MKRSLLGAAVLASTAACATILDFQDPVDRVAAASERNDGAATTVTADPNAPAPGPTSSTDSGGNDVATTTEKSDDELDATVAKECRCVPTAPAGWSGPFVVAQGSGDVPGCIAGSDYELEAYAGRSESTAGPAQCSCSCGAPVEVACSVPTASLYADVACLTPVCHVAESALGCTDVLACDVASKKVVAVGFGETTPSGGRCVPSATVTVPAVGWKRSIRLCAPRSTAADCDGGVCQTTPSPLFSKTNRCIKKDGDIAQCPAAFPVRQLFHSGSSDTRGCTACACDAPAGVACHGGASIVSGSCKDAPAPALDLLGCQAVGSGARVVTTAGTPTGGSCEASGGQATGAFTEGAPTTVCCLE